MQHKRVAKSKTKIEYCLHNQPDQILKAHEKPYKKDDHRLYIQRRDAEGNWVELQVQHWTKAIQAEKVKSRPQGEVRTGDYGNNSCTYDEPHLRLPTGLVIEKGEKRGITYVNVNGEQVRVKRIMKGDVIVGELSALGEKTFYKKHEIGKKIRRKNQRDDSELTISSSSAIQEPVSSAPTEDSLSTLLVAAESLAPPAAAPLLPEGIIKPAIIRPREGKVLSLFFHSNSDDSRAARPSLALTRSEGSAFFDPKRRKLADESSHSSLPPIPQQADADESLFDESLQDDARMLLSLKRSRED